MRVHALRLVPGDDIKRSILAFCLDRRLASARIITAVGSVRALTIRLANHAAHKVSSAPRRRRRRPPPTTFSASPINALRSCRSSVPCPRTGRRVTCTWRARTRAGTSSGTPVGGHRRLHDVRDRVGIEREVRFERELDEATGFDELVVREGGGGGTGVAGTTGKRARRARQRPRRRGNERRRAIVRNRRERCSDGSRA